MGEYYLSYTLDGVGYDKSFGYFSELAAAVRYFYSIGADDIQVIDLGTDDEPELIDIGRFID